MSNDIDPPYPPTTEIKRTAVRIAGHCVTVEASRKDLDRLHTAHGRRTTLKQTITRLLYEFTRTIEANGIDDPAHYAHAINNCRVVIDGVQRSPIGIPAPESSPGHDGRGAGQLAREDTGPDNKPRHPESLAPGQPTQEEVKGKAKRGKSTKR